MNNIDATDHGRIGQATAVFGMQPINRKDWGKHTLGAAAKHNKREIPDKRERIDPERTHLNVSLFGLPSSAAEVLVLANRLMENRGYKPARADSVIAVEGVFSLKSPSDVPDLIAFFTDCAKWFVAHMRGDLLAADIHLDEDHPHAHVLVLLPLTNGGPSGSALIGSKPQIEAHQRAFQSQVPGNYGLAAPPAALTRVQRRELTREVHRVLIECDDPVRRHPLWSLFAWAIDQKPREASALIRKALEHVDQRSTPIEVASFSSNAQEPAVNESTEASGDRHLPCVDVASFSSTRPICEGPPREFLREREGDQRAEAWDSDAGEFRRPAEPVDHANKAAADAWVLAALATSRAARKPAAVLAEAC